MNCPKCKTVILKGEKECSNCGYKITLKIKNNKTEDTVVSTNEVTQPNNADTSDFNELNTYLRDVLETEIILKKHIENMGVIEKKSGRKPKYNPPDRPECIYPNKKTIEKPVKESWWKATTIFLILAVFFGYVYYCAFESIHTRHIRVWIQLICGLICSLNFGIAIGCPSITNSDYKKKLAEHNQKVVEENTRYAEECKKIKEENEAKYQEMFSEYETEYKKQCKEYEDYKNRIEGELHSIKKKLLDKLQALYDKNILHPKYRNLDAVAAIYDYISTGRCEGLEGRDGAYNLYEEKLKQDKEDADREKLVSKIKELETELKNKAEQERINQWLMSNQLSMLKDSLEFESERLRDQYSADISRLLADGQSIF